MRPTVLRSVSPLRGYARCWFFPCVRLGRGGSLLDGEDFFLLRGIDGFEGDCDGAHEAECLSCDVVLRGLFRHVGAAGEAVGSDDSAVEFFVKCDVVEVYGDFEVFDGNLREFMRYEMNRTPLVPPLGCGISLARYKFFRSCIPPRACAFF